MSPPISPAMHPISLNLQLPTRCKAPPEATTCWASPPSSSGTSPSFSAPTACVPTCHQRQSPTPSRTSPIATAPAVTVTESMPPPSPLALSATWRSFPTYAAASTPVRTAAFGQPVSPLHAPFT
eukprot:GGOE01009089.1.p3 GENE.GGOE01009089.1~~GGOE01009089.1.p3  ORF type:complete len:124 (+),score=23.68 GGOE01009089.1:92-463(+)